MFKRKCVWGGYRFGNTQVTRPYMDLLDTRNAEKIFLNLKTIWDNIDVIVVEGEQTRMGVGNDLLSNAKSIKRILAPSENAYDKYNDILEAIRKHYHGGLVLIALGPTATVLAGELAENNIWALDVGHIDIEYEWYRQKAKGKVAIPGKYVNEAGIEGRTVSECDDFEYLRQIEERLY